MRVRIVSENGNGHDSHVFLLDEDGGETEISRLVTAAEIRVDACDRNTATLSLLLVGIDVVAELEDVLIEHVAPDRLDATIAKLVAARDALDPLPSKPDPHLSPER